jgi:hypothetical protein
MTEALGFQPLATPDPLDLQRISVKILTDAPRTLDLNPFLLIFARWRTDTSQWVDLADYAHMPAGPGIVLVGRLYNFSFDLGSEAPGVLYTSKKGLEGTTEERLQSVLRSGFEMARALASEKEFPAEARLRPGALELTFNDRLDTPNTEATDRLLRPAVRSVLDRLMGLGAYQARPEVDPARRYGFSIRSDNPPSLDELRARLKS